MLYTVINHNQKKKYNIHGLTTVRYREIFYINACSFTRLSFDHDYVSALRGSFQNAAFQKCFYVPFVSLCSAKLRRFFNIRGLLPLSASHSVLVVMFVSSSSAGCLFKDKKIVQSAFFHPPSSAQAATTL